MSYGAPRFARPRAVWAALITGLLVSALIVLGVLLPNLGLIGAADASTLGVLDVPVGQIALAIVISFVLGLILLGMKFASRNGAVAWIASVAAIVATLVGSVAPLVVTAFASVGQAGEVIPFIQQLIASVTG